MKTALLIAAVLTTATATPNGYYHQEYNYKTSASSYRNNELQHKTDDQGYYSKDGDLEGRVKPKVSANSEHSEYVNPRILEGGTGAGYYDAGSDTTSHGNMLANSYGASSGSQSSGGYQAGSQYARNLNSEGLASSDYIGAASGYSGSYSSGSESSYESANLRSIGSRLQNDLQRELQSALVGQRQVDITQLEAELRRNLTARLNEVLQERYGTQTIRGGQSYSLVGGRLQARPNYEQRELEQLQRQIEGSLLQELRRTSHSSHQAINQNYERFESTTTYRPYTYRPIYPDLSNIGTQNQYTYGGQYSDSQRSEFNTNRLSSNIEFTQIPNAPSITTIASNVQTELNNRLNRLLEDSRRQYFSENSRVDSYNTGPVLERLKQELRQNLTYALDEELRRNFGTQLQKSGYMFTVRTNGDTPNQYNYQVADLENLRRQVEENLVTKLARDFEAARQHWTSSQQHSQTQQNFYGQNRLNDHYIASNNLPYVYSTPRYVEDDYNRPTAQSIIPLIGQHQLVPASRYGGYEASGGSSNIAQLQSRLQSDLSNQLQAALSQNRAYSGRYSAAGEGRASFEEAYRRLYEELQRNLTQQLQSYGTGSSGYSTSYGGVSENQLAQLRSQLQRNLASQLQQGLQQSYSASASYSASSGSTASAGGGSFSSGDTGAYYRAARGSDVHGQYGAGAGYLTQTEDCQGDDPLARQHYRSKRSYGYRSRPLGLSTQTGGGYTSGGTYGGYYGYRSYTQVGQAQDDSELVPSPAYSSGTNHQEIGQEIDDTDDTQQTEDHGWSAAYGHHITVDQEETSPPSRSYSSIQSHGRQTVGQEEDNSELNPPSRRYSSVQSHGRQTVGQEEDNSELSPPSRSYSSVQSHGRYEVGQEIAVGQEEDDSELGPQSRRYSSVQSHGRQTVGQEEDNSELIPPSRRYSSVQSHGRQTVGQEEINSELNPPSRRYSSVQSHVGQEIDDIGDTQQVEVVHEWDTAYGKQVAKGQVEDDSDDTQQVEVDHGFGSIDLGSQSFVRSTSTSTTPYPSTTQNQKPISNVFNSDVLRPLQTSRKPPYGSGYVRPYSYTTERVDIGQEEDDSDNVQLLDSNQDSFGGIGVGSQVGQRRNLTGTEEIQQGSSGYQKYQPAKLSPPQHNVGQQEDDSDDDIEQRTVDNVFDTSVETSTTLRSQTGFNIPISTPRTPIQNNQNPGVWHNFGEQPTNPDTTRPYQFGSHLQPQYNPVNTLLLQPSSQVEPAGPIQPTTSTVPPSTSVQPNRFDSNVYVIPVRPTQPPVEPNQFDSNFYVEPIRPIQRPSTTPIDPTRFDSNFNIEPVDPIQRPSTPIDYNIKPIRPIQPTTISTTPKTQYNLQFGPENVVPENERVEPLPNPVLSVTPSQKPVSSQAGSQTGPVYTNVVSVQEANIPIRLKGFSTKIQTDITNEIKEVIKNELPRSIAPNQLYKETLETLQTSITLTCENLLQERRYSYLNIQQSEVIIIERYLQAYLVQTLNEEFRTSGYVRPGTINYVSVTSYGSQYGYRPTKPQTSPNEFLEREINSEGNLNTQIRPTPKSIESDSFNNGDIPSQRPPKVVPSSTLPAPTIPQTPNTDDRLLDAQSESDLLIKRLRDYIHNKTTHSSNSQYHQTRVIENYQPQTRVIQVKLENITPEQLTIINNVESSFATLTDSAVQSDYASSNLDHTSKYELYRISLNRLEEELRRNLSDCIQGKGQNLQNANLGLYSNLINEKFEHNKISDVQTYLEIRLIKRIRAQLRKLYNIETTEDTYETSGVPEYIPQQVTYETRTVRLENITPQQLKVIRQIENDINGETEAAIETRVTTLRGSQTSKYYYQQSLDVLESELKNKIAESIHKLCEPGFSQYSQLVATNFDTSKISDLEKYLEIRLFNKLRENIIRYSSSETSVGHAYNSYQYSSNQISEIHRSQPASPSAYRPPAVSSISSVKGGYSSNQHVEVPQIQTLDEPLNNHPDAEIISSPETSSDEPVDPTTPAPNWWKRFENKVKHGASRLKEKIVGKS